jgi:hypothetical protein
MGLRLKTGGVLRELRVHANEVTDGEGHVVLEVGPNLLRAYVRDEYELEGKTSFLGIVEFYLIGQSTFVSDAIEESSIGFSDQECGQEVLFTGMVADILSVDKPISQTGGGNWCFSYFAILYLGNQLSVLLRADRDVDKICIGDIIRGRASVSVRAYPPHPPVRKGILHSLVELWNHLEK